MSNEQKPSVGDREIARQIDPDCLWDSCLICEARAIRVSKILARVRREARAEAFEEAKELCLERGRSNRRSIVSSGTVRSYESDACADALRALAAKERAK